MVSPARHLGTTLVALAVPILTIGCKSGPTASDYLVDARDAAREERYEEAETFAELAAERGAAERDTRILRAKIQRNRAIDALDAGEDKEAYRLFVEAGEIDPRRVTSSRYFRKAVELGQEIGMSSHQLAQTAQKAVDADPSSLKARRLAAKLWDASGAYERALDSYLWIWQSDRSRTRIGRRLATMYRRLERPSDAISILERIVKRSPDDAQAALKLAELYVEHGAPERARSLYEGLLEQYPNKAGILMRYSRFLRDRGDLERARALRKRALEQLPGTQRRKMRELQ